MCMWKCSFCLLSFDIDVMDVWVVAAMSILCARNDGLECKV